MIYFHYYKLLLQVKYRFKSQFVYLDKNIFLSKQIAIYSVIVTDNAGIYTIEYQLVETFSNV